MTVEQGGIGAGREVTMENGVSVTIKDRLTHHATTVLTIVESAASQVEPLLKGFRGFMNTSRKTMKGKYATYVMKSNPKLSNWPICCKKTKSNFRMPMPNNQQVVLIIKRKKRTALPSNPMI